MSIKLRIPGQREAASSATAETVAVRRPDAGKIARLWAKLGADAGAYELRMADVNGQPGVVATDPEGRVGVVITLGVAGSRVISVWAVVNPDKLARVPTAARA